MEKKEAEDLRPWGRYQVIEETGSHKVKRVTIHPGRRLSLQRHRFRAEHWFVVQGEALVTRDGAEMRMSKGQSIDIPRGSFHRICNSGEEDLVFVEIQTGEYFGEDDIERVEDDYGRA